MSCCVVDSECCVSCSVITTKGVVSGICLNCAIITTKGFVLSLLSSSCRSPVGHTVSPVCKTKCAVLSSSTVLCYLSCVSCPAITAKGVVVCVVCLVQ